MNVFRAETRAHALIQIHSAYEFTKLNSSGILQQHFCSVFLVSTRLVNLSDMLNTDAHNFILLILGSVCYLFIYFICLVYILLYNYFIFMLLDGWETYSSLIFPTSCVHTYRVSLLLTNLCYHRIVYGKLPFILSEISCTIFNSSTMDLRSFHVVF